MKHTEGILPEKVEKWKCHDEYVGFSSENQNELTFGLITVTDEYMSFELRIKRAEKIQVCSKKCNAKWYEKVLF